MSGFDLTNDIPAVPEHLKGLCQGRMVRYVHPSGAVRPAVVINVVNKMAGLVELQVFAGNDVPVVFPLGEDKMPLPLPFDRLGSAFSWHWPPREA
jgi:hypothetical protein